MPCRNLFEYDQVLNTQRDSIYAERRQALLIDDLSSILVDYAKKTVDDILEADASSESFFEICV